MPELSSRVIDSSKGRRHSDRRRTERQKSVAAEEHDASSASVTLHGLSVLVVLVAAAIFTLTEHHGHRHSWWFTAELAVQMLFVPAAVVWIRKFRPDMQSSAFILPALLLVVILSLICEPFRRLMTGHGMSFEILVMHSQCNLMLGLAICGFRATYQRLAVMIGVFLTVFCCTISSGTALVLLTIVFAVLCLAWLTASWWESVHRRLLPENDRRISPLWTGALICTPVLILAAGGAAGGPSVTTAINGFLPSSGGTGEYDPWCRGGVNNGDALVAGNNNIRSFAPIEDAPFVDSDKPSLYDVFNESFDDPVFRPKQIQRSIALPGEQLKHIHQKMAEARKAGREFQLVRERRKTRQGRMHDVESDALFYVAGRLPAHLRMEVYEHFDGETWYPLDAKVSDSGPEIKQTEERAWLEVPVRGAGFDVFSEAETHTLTVSNLSGNVIPSPPHLAGVSIDRVDRADMYEISAYDIVSLQRESIPSMTPVHVVSHNVIPQILAETLSNRTPQRQDSTTVLPQESVDRIQQLANQWTADVPHGWGQVEAITSKLRTDYDLDREAALPPDCADPVAAFLFEEKRGPEYMFASSAACLLRTLGYSTRVVSGFYARPERYDARSRHTAVIAKDAHFWCEVFIGARTWMTVEASPGYHIRGPRKGIIERLTSLLWRTFETLVNRRWTVMSVLAIVCLLVWQRAVILDLGYTMRWKLKTGGDLCPQVIELAQLVDRRLRMSGFSRHAGTTMQRWASQPELRDVSDDLKRLGQLADQAAFGHGPARCSREELKQLADRCTLTRLRKVRRGRRAADHGYAATAQSS